MAEQYVNHVQSTIATVGGINDSVNTFDLADGTGFPTANFRIRVEDEIMLVGSRSGVTLSSITRGAEGTSAASHAQTVEVDHFLTAGAIDQVRADIVLTGTYASLPSAGNEGRLYLPTDSPYILRDTGAAWEHWLGSIGKVTPPPSSGWSWDNQAGSSISTGGGFEYFTALDQAAPELCVRYRTAPTAPYTLDIVLRHDISSIPPGSAPTGNRFGYAVGFRESDTGKIVDFRMGHDISSWSILTSKWTTSTSFSAGYTVFNAGQLFAFVVKNPMFLRIEDDSTNLKFYWSIDYVNWEEFDSQLRGDFLASAGPDQVFFAAYPHEQDVRMSILGWTEG